MQETWVPSLGQEGSIPGSGRFPGKGNSNPLQYSCLGHPMDRGAWQAIVRGIAKSWTRLSMHAWSNMMLKDNREMRREQNEQNRERSWLRKKSWVVCSSEKVKILKHPTSTIWVR